MIARLRSSRGLICSILIEFLLTNPRSRGQEAAEAKFDQFLLNSLSRTRDREAKKNERYIFIRITIGIQISSGEIV